MSTKPCGDEDEELAGPPGAAAPDASSEPGPGSEDPGLAALSLPAAAIRRVAKSAAPDVHFSREAIAGLHRVAQAFVCFATERALHEAKKEADKAKKPKGKTNPTARKTLTADHMMKFLSADMPPVAKKLATLFPELMPTEYKPAGVRLLEQLQEQDKAAEDAARRADMRPELDAAAAPKVGATLLTAFASAPHMEGPVDEAVEEAPAHVRPEASEPKRKRGGGDGEPAAKKSAKAQGDGEPAAKKPAKAPAAAPLERFFGKRASVPVEAPVATPARAANQAAGPATGDADDMALTREDALSAGGLQPSAPCIPAAASEEEEQHA